MTSIKYHTSQDSQIVNKIPQSKIFNAIFHEQQNVNRNPKVNQKAGVINYCNSRKPHKNTFRKYMQSCWVYSMIFFKSMLLELSLPVAELE